MRKRTVTGLGACLGVLLLLQACSDPTKGKPVAVVNESASAAPTAQETTPGASGAVYAISDTSTIGFTGSKVTGSHTGGFKEFTGTVTVADGDPASARIGVSIKTDSIWSDTDRLTGHLKSADFFDATQFPETTFTSTAIQKEGDQFSVTGDLNLHGVTQSITFPAAITVDGDQVTAQAEFSINRFDFEIKYPGKSDDLIRENVLIKLDIAAQAQ